MSNYEPDFEDKVFVWAMMLLVFGLPVFFLLALVFGLCHHNASKEPSLDAQYQAAIEDFDNSLKSIQEGVPAQ